MAGSRRLVHFFTVLCVFVCYSSASVNGAKRGTSDKCSYKGTQFSSADESGRKLGVTFRYDNCSLNWNLLGKHAIHEVNNITYTHLSCDSQAAVVVHWMASPLGRFLLSCVCETILKHPTFQFLSQWSPNGVGLSFSCEVLLGPDNLVCKPFWKPKTLNVSQLGSNLHVVFDHAPSTFGFTIYYLYYKLRQEGPFRLKRCKPLRDDNNTTRKQTQYHVSQVHSPWAGPIRAMAITVPLVIMSAFATLFTVMCRKKQQENIYSHLDEESPESSSQTTALSADRPWPRPKIFICYSSRDCPKHLAVIQSFAFFLQDFCGCEVALDLWEHLEICKEGQMSWLSRRIDEAHFIITVCSKGLKYFVEKRHRKGKATSKENNREPTASDSAGNRDLFIVATAMIAEKLKEVHQKSSDLSRFMSVYFDYSHESDVPTSLSLAPKYKLMDQLPLLFARLHSRQLSLTHREPQPPNVSKRNYFRSKSGRSLYVAICNMHQHIEQEPDWFEKQLMPPPSKRLPPPEKLDSGLVLNEVKLKHPSESDCPVRSNVLMLPPTPRLGLSLSLSQEDLGEGDEEPPAVSSLHCAAPTICKAELHHNIHQSEGLIAAAST
uniref:Interleukin-17 receptor D n=1 Tax=Cyprinus carpio TaxID=7962 RepID=A0A8C1ZD80_CYPCA